MEKSILLVEDEEALRMTLGDRLRGEGYRVDCAGDGEAGFQKAMSLPFDLMVLDIMLPRRSGLDVCRDIRLAGLRTPVLMLTARHDPEYMEAGFKAGADDYVTKPFDVREVSARIEALLRRPLSSRSIPYGSEGPPNTRPQHREGSVFAPTINRHSAVDPVASADGKLPEEFYRHFGAKDAQRLGEVLPEMRKMLEKERETPQTSENTALLNAAQGIIEFLEEIFERIRSPKPRC